jgi:hypothetical protein
VLKYSARDRVRFWSNVSIAAGGCAEWNGSITSSGYGTFWHSGKLRAAHRVAFELAFGNIPDMVGADQRGTCILHRCDNPRCVNPEHLFVGTHADNMVDMDSKGRRVSLPGVSNPRAVLEPEEVSEIRKLRGQVSQRALALRFGVSKSQVGNIQRGDAWVREVKRG